ncbi:MAG: hypothetical protein U5K79_16840 [Cyclobacteriaceae bacterium]|nr:hypothetical protein [Cyclobacteriaceae bacterium]
MAKVYTNTMIIVTGAAGFSHQMHSLEDGVQDYVQNYLVKQRYY